ncbi:MAG: hypothetical protein WCO67_26880 [Betaproteobacteria bacterium]
MQAYPNQSQNMLEQRNLASDHGLQQPRASEIAAFGKTVGFGCRLIGMGMRFIFGGSDLRLILADGRKRRRLLNVCKL